MFGLAYNQTNSRVSLYLVEGGEFMAATVHACVCRVVQWLTYIAGCMTLFGWQRMWVWVHAVTAMEWYIEPPYLWQPISSN